MSWTQSAYNIFKRLVVIDSRISDLSAAISAVSRTLDSTTDRLTRRIDDHAERLARLEGKFELLETSFSGRRHKLSE